MEAVVGLRQALVVADHQGGTEFVVRVADGFQGRIGLEALGEREGLEAVRRGVTQIVLQRRREESGPGFVGAGLEDAEE